MHHPSTVLFEDKEKGGFEWFCAGSNCGNRKGGKEDDFCHIGHVRKKSQLWQSAKTHFTAAHSDWAEELYPKKEIQIDLTAPAVTDIYAEVRLRVAQKKTLPVSKF